MSSQFEGLVLEVPKPAVAFLEGSGLFAGQKAKSHAFTRSAGNHGSCKWTISICHLGPGAPFRSVARPFLIGNDEGVSDTVSYVHVTNFDPELRALAVVLPHGLAQHAEVERPAAE